MLNGSSCRMIRAPRSVRSSRVTSDSGSAFTNSRVWDSRPAASASRRVCSRMDESMSPTMCESRTARRRSWGLIGAPSVSALCLTRYPASMPVMTSTTGENSERTPPERTSSSRSGPPMALASCVTGATPLFLLRALPVSHTQAAAVRKPSRARKLRTGFSWKIRSGGPEADCRPGGPRRSHPRRPPRRPHS